VHTNGKSKDFTNGNIFEDWQNQQLWLVTLSPEERTLTILQFMTGAAIFTIAAMIPDRQ
jgi:hypothetical protein